MNACPFCEWRIKIEKIMDEIEEFQEVNYLFDDELIENAYDKLDEVLSSLSCDCLT